jgi:hypothetical protein
MQSVKSLPLELGVFGAHKAEYHRIRVSSGLNPNMGRLAKIIGGRHKSTTQSNIVRAFKAAGMCARWSEKPQTFLTFIDQESAARVCEWKVSEKRAQAPLCNDEDECIEIHKRNEKPKPMEQLGSASKSQSKGQGALQPNRAKGLIEDDWPKLKAPFVTKEEARKKLPWRTKLTEGNIKRWADCGGASVGGRITEPFKVRRTGDY